MYVRDVEALHLAGDLRGEGAGSKRVMRVMPDRPARMFVPRLGNGDCRPGEMMPEAGDDDSATCAIALRRSMRRSAADQAFLRWAVDVVDGLLDGGDLLRFLVRDLALELLLEGHHQFDRVERIGARGR